MAKENCAPYSMSTYQAGDTFMSNRAAKFKACATAFKACTVSGYWPGLSGDGVLDIEPWQQFASEAAWQVALATGTTGASD